MIQTVFHRNDAITILKEMCDNLPSHKYDVGQKVISELCSKLIEQITAQHFTKKMQSPVTAGVHDTDPDVYFHNLQKPLEIKVAMTGGNRLRWRGGGLTDRACDYLFIARNRDSTEFFAALCHMQKSDWVLQKTQYFAPYFTETMLFDKNPKVLLGSFGVSTRGKNKGSPILVLEKL